MFDADKLDVIGAIGISRSFIIAGQYGEKIYSDVPIDEYIKDNLVGGKQMEELKIYQNMLQILNLKQNSNIFPISSTLQKPKKLLNKE